MRYTMFLSNTFCLFCHLPFLLSVNISGDSQSFITTSEALQVKNIPLVEASEIKDLLNDSDVEHVVTSAIEPSVDIDLNLKMDIENSKNINQPKISNILKPKLGVAEDIYGKPVTLTLSDTVLDKIETFNKSSTRVEDTRESSPSNMSDLHRELVNVTKNISKDNEQEFITELLNQKKNLTEEKSEEIPSFSEWTQKRLREVEQDEQVNVSFKGQNIVGKGSNAKIQWKNYASLDCGAKVIAANPEAISPGAVLSPSTDEYKLNTCTSRIWFIVELCETIQTKKIELANYELFSSSPKEFIVSVSDRYPTRDWSIVGKFIAKDERGIQYFFLDTQIFGKYIRVEIKSHYGSEHYCPISLFRAYGTSEFEVLQKEDPAHVIRIEDDDEDDDEHSVSFGKEDEDLQKNLFSSATNAVISIVKKAAEVLGNKMNNETSPENNKTLKYSHYIDGCITPCNLIFCNNCSSSQFAQIYEIVSCKNNLIRELVQITLIYNTLISSRICNTYGYNFKFNINITNAIVDTYIDYVKLFFSFEYLAAMCHEFATLKKEGILNNTQQFSNVTERFTDDKIVKIKVLEPHVKKTETGHSLNENLHETLLSDILDENSKSSSRFHGLENISHASQIKPTKAILPDLEIRDSSLKEKSSEPVEVRISTESTEILAPEFLFENNVDPTIEAEIMAEGMEPLDVHLDLISELNIDDGENIPISPTTTTNSPQAQRESIFVRLSNRIKALERNMSLSSQYLEELSKRYKKQVEEMQNLLEKTITSLREESLKQDQRNRQLEERLDNLTTVIESLLSEKYNWFSIIGWLIFSFITTSTIYFFCSKPPTVASTRDAKENFKILRRKSVDDVTITTEKRNRRPSDQALKIVRCSSTIDDNDKNKINQKYKKRKKPLILRSNSVNNIKERSFSAVDIAVTDWVEKCNQVSEGIPFVLEDCDHSTLESCTLANQLVEVVPLNHLQPTCDIKVNGVSNQNDVNISTKLSCIHHLKTDSCPVTSNRINTSTVEPRKERKGFKKLLKKVF